MTRNYTIEELYRKGRDLIFRTLISVSGRSEKVYYSDISALLSYNVVNGHVSSQVVGRLVGTLMEEIEKIAPATPPINTLVISKTTKLPSEGSDIFLKRYFHLARLPSAARKVELSELAANDVWSFRDWPQIYSDLTGKNLEIENIAGLQEYDDDGQPDNPKYGGLPESEEHKKLKDHIYRFPSILGLKTPIDACKERKLLSGDEVDVEFTFEKARIAVEVKSCRSGNADLIRGIYQCIKYRALLTAQYQPDDVRGDAILVTEYPLPNHISRLARRLKVKTKVVPVNI